MLTWQELQAMAQVAKERFKPVKKKYPELKPYLVFCSRKGQADIDGSPDRILQDFPAMVIDSPVKSQATESLTQIRLLDLTNASQAAKDKEKQRLQTFLPGLRYNIDTNVEVRFDRLKYNLIRQLQVDSLIDTELTWAHGASIRIILTILAKLRAEMEDNNGPSSESPAVGNGHPSRVHQTDCFIFAERSRVKSLPLFSSSSQPKVILQGTYK